MAIVSVVCTPLGPACTVRTAAGGIVRGYRVPDDYRGPEFVHHGECVRAVWLDAKSGAPVETPEGRQLTGPAPGGGVELVKAEAYRLEVVPTDPPALP